MSKYQVELFNNGDSQFQVRSDDYVFTIDTQGNGVTPPAALLASVGSCVGVYIRKYYEGAHLAVPTFRVLVQAEFSQDQPIRFRSMQVSIELSGAPLDDRRKNALLAFVKHCPVHNTLLNTPQIDIAISS